MHMQHLHPLAHLSLLIAQGPSETAQALAFLDRPACSALADAARTEADRLAGLCEEETIGLQIRAFQATFARRLKSEMFSDGSRRSWVEGVAVGSTFSFEGHEFVLVPCTSGSLQTVAARITAASVTRLQRLECDRQAALLEFALQAEAVRPGPVSA